MWVFIKPAHKPNNELYYSNDLKWFYFIKWLIVVAQSFLMVLEQPV